MLVVDASAVAGWLLPDEGGTDPAALLAGEEPIAAPWLLWAELRNILVVNERRGRIPAGIVEQAVEAVEGLGIALDTAPSGPGVLALARRHGLTVYDALSLELRAARAGAARDARRRAAARGGGGGGRGGLTRRPRRGAAGARGAGPAGRMARTRRRPASSSRVKAKSVRSAVSSRRPGIRSGRARPRKAVRPRPASVASIERRRPRGAGMGLGEGVAERPVALDEGVEERGEVAVAAPGADDLKGHGPAAAPRSSPRSRPPLPRRHRLLAGAGGEEAAERGELGLARLGLGAQELEPALDHRREARVAARLDQPRGRSPPAAR